MLLLRMFRCARWLVLLVVVSLLTSATSRGLSADQSGPSQAEATEILHRVVDFYRTQVGFRGAMLWRYSADLTHFEGEETATRTSGWTQPPGSPFIGEAYLDCWRMTGDQQLLDAAVEVAHALTESQLRSGGWSSHFDLSAAGRQKYAYRSNGPQDQGKSNRTTFDDNKSQSALTLLMHVDEALKFQDTAIHEAVDYALKQMLRAQYPNGAWPQQYSEFAEASEFPIRRADYPKHWPRQFPGRRYTGDYTLNDGNMGFLIEMFFEAHRIYGRADCRRAAVATGEFFLLAQMPQPQPGWAQQYDRLMHPVWARKFEPPAITGGESQGVMKSLLLMYRQTGDRRFLEPLPSALAYFRASLLADGRLARFYELKTNRPLYFTKDYRLTYDDSDVPTHYAFKVKSRLDSIEREYHAVLNLPPEKRRPVRPVGGPVVLTDRVRQQAWKVIKSLDGRGAWVEIGKMRHQTEPLPVIDMRTFATNLRQLAAYCGAIP